MSKTTPPPIFSCLICFLFAVLNLHASSQTKLPKGVFQFFEKHCYECHDDDVQKGDLNLYNLPNAISNSTDGLNWQDILDQLNAGEMPPEKKPRPAKADLMNVIGELTDTLFNARKALHDSQGDVALRRLNKREYQATIKSLIGIELDPTELPDDTGGRYDTIGEEQTMDSMQLKKFFELAQKIAAMGLHWAQQPRENSGAVRKDFARTTKTYREYSDNYKKLDLVLKEGKTPEEAGFSEKEWKRFNPKNPGPHKIMRSWAAYWDRHAESYDKGRFLRTGRHHFPSVKFDLDARAQYKINLSAGLVEGIEKRRIVRFTGGISHSKALATMFIDGSVDQPKINSINYRPTFKPGHLETESQLSIFEDIRADQGLSHQTEHLKLVEPNAPLETIFIEWIEIEGPFYDSKSSLEKLVDKYSITSSNEQQLDHIAPLFLSDFAKEAFRQHVIPQGLIKKLSTYYQGERSKGLDFQQAIIHPIAIILSSPSFLYLQEPRDKVKKLDPLHLANRLSYFLWSSPPDRELYNLASKGELVKQQVLNAQVDRMLKDPKAQNFYKGFMEQWSYLDRYDDLNLSPRLHLSRTDGMIQSARQEPIEFFKTLILENLSASNLIDSDFVTIDGLLATRYGLDYSDNGFQKIKLPKGSPRGGLMTQAAFLSTGTMGDRTSPVIRGSLVKEVLLKDPPPPPPPNVPELIHAGKEKFQSVRSLVEMHQQKAQCASCHKKFDFIGLGLENFDAAGIWREEELVTEVTDATKLSIHKFNKKRKKGEEIEHNCKTFPVSSHGSLPNGREFKDVHGLKEVISLEKDTVAESLLEGILAYALGRNISFTDKTITDKILKDLSHHDYPTRTMIKKLVTSPLFLKP